MLRIALFFASVLAASGARSTISLSADDASAKNRPVSKVVTLLKNMQKQLEKEATEDEEVYEKLQCWCKTNDKEKSKAILSAEKKIKQLTAKIEELTATSARLNTEIDALKAEVAKDQESLEQATSQREKALAEFNAEEKDLLESISALKAAVAVLSEHNSLLQVPQDHVLGLAATLQHEMQKHSDMLAEVITPSEQKFIAAFVQQPQDYFDAAPTFKQSYAPQSGQIFGILKQMQETFEANLKNAQEEENKAQKAYEELKAAKEAQIAAGKAQIESKTQELADTDEKNAQAKLDKDDTMKTLAADEEFLMKLKEKCSMTDSEWEERQKTRQLEMSAVAKALSVLTADDAHDTFTNTFSLVQTKSESESDRRKAVSTILSNVAKKFNNPRLSTLAYRAKLDAFTRVKKAIDEMIAQLTKEKEAEIKHKDFCVDEFDKNQLTTEKKEREKSDLEAEIEDLELTIKTLQEDIEKLESEIEEMKVQLKRAGEDREMENAEYQETIWNQRETQRLLKRALGYLEEFYGKAEGSFVQKQEPVGPPPPPGFKAYKKNAASGGVFAMIQQILEDAKAMETEAKKTEEDALMAYASFVQETNSGIEARRKERTNKLNEKATAEQDLVSTKEARQEVMNELEDLSNYNAQLHKSCDYIMKNFEVRQTARDEEIEALKQAKAILSGAKFENFLQR